MKDMQQLADTLSAESDFIDGCVQAPKRKQTKIITIRLEGGMVTDVDGVPAGYALHVEDYDYGDDSNPNWDAEKECFVTIYEGGAA
jgi:hypothetical protein